MVFPGALALSAFQKGSLSDRMRLYEINRQAIEDFGLVYVANVPRIIDDF